ncbi:uncharacterized protein I303_102557 [Kwoniella dejecticola CBS 10117]|uniref:Uncharacterized protein n=1 Tax=Kwoniella dejecticola CBS 10117 TaxID=1296121 RepID=A0A1A6A930_9TREE|nr:uncharacterized protein I303_02571 [Kwoniella dejecticola CBS 10117]OBR86563.1 hypothetical protein I303_02571 [Kwoniella dejecticola CBS 10117]
MLISSSALLTFAFTLLTVRAGVIQRDDEGKAVVGIIPPDLTRLVPDEDTSKNAGANQPLALYWSEQMLKDLGKDKLSEKVVWWDWFEDNGSTVNWHIKCKARINTSKFKGQQTFQLNKKAPWTNVQTTLAPDVVAFGCFEKDSNCIGGDCDKMPFFDYDHKSGII